MSAGAFPGSEQPNTQLACEIASWGFWCDWGGDLALACGPRPAPFTLRSHAPAAVIVPAALPGEIEVPRAKAKTIRGKKVPSKKRGVKKPPGRSPSVSPSLDTPNYRQQAFVREFLIDLSPADAYMRAYQIDNRESAQTSANRLLQNVAILDAIDQAQRQRMERLDLDGDWVVTGFRIAYLRAMQHEDFTAVIKALENIGKFLGIYERDNRQKSRELTLEEVDRLKAELEMRGYDFRRRNFPPELVGVPGGDPPRALPADAVVIDNTPAGQT